MRKHLQKLAEYLPDDFKAKLTPFENGDFLRLLTLTEMTGEDENWREADGQIDWMNDRRHRIAIRKGNAYENGWTATPVSCGNFAYIKNHGSAATDYALANHGIRPAFQVKA